MIANVSKILHFIATIIVTEESFINFMVLYVRRDVIINPFIAPLSFKNFFQLVSEDIGRCHPQAHIKKVLIANI